jgi:hypothetical protein
MERKQAHLQMILGVVNRLSQNSFLLKGWSVVLVSALFALAASDRKLYFIYLAYFPAIAFWVLDGYFLWQERLFRALYDHVRGLKDEEIDFAMDTSIIKNRAKAWQEMVFSMTLLGFHGTVLASVLLVMLITALLG